MNHEPQASGFRLKIDFAQASNPGRDPNKQVNEDSCGYAETRFGHLAVLCDGMGGHYGGKEASRTAITTIFEMFEQLAAAMAARRRPSRRAIEEAGRRVYLLGGPPENRTRPGSTVVAMLLHDRGLDVAHVGDSRAYVIRSNQIYPLTRDHSMVQGMIDAGMLTEESAMGHPDSNKITRALGMRPDVDVELRPEVDGALPRRRAPPVERRPHRPRARPRHPRRHPPGAGLRHRRARRATCWSRWPTTAAATTTSPCRWCA